MSKPRNQKAPAARKSPGRGSGTRGKKTGKKRGTVSPRNGADVSAHQFKPGNPGGPGRRPVRHIREAIHELAEAGAIDLTAILKATGRDAMKGDNSARRLLFEFGWGKPMQPIELSTPVGFAEAYAALRAELPE